MKRPGVLCLIVHEGIDAGIEAYPIASVHSTTYPLHIRRVKNGTPATHPLTGRELRALRKLQRESCENPFVFVSERGAPFSVSGFRRMIERAGQAAGLEIKTHPHMLRHATGYALANQGTDTRTLQAYLGHRNISNTVRYTELAAGRFRNLWKD